MAVSVIEMAPGLAADRAGDERIERFAAVNFHKAIIIELVLELIKLAQSVRQNAYAPYSHYQVGAALETVAGSTYTGCNAEVASYSETDHAERSAISQAIIAGAARDNIHFIKRMAVVHDQGTPPCGGCLQRIAEHATPETMIITATPDGQQTGEYRLVDLLPYSFKI